MQAVSRTRLATDQTLMGTHWQRLLLFWLLSPLLWLQGWHVRRVTPRMPEPPGRRAGATGKGSLIRLLVAGDSGAAGVGAPTQDQALCGQLVRLLSQHHTVEWCVLEANGLDSPGLLKLLQSAPCAQFDVVVLSMGANDATGLCAPIQWAQWQTRLGEIIEMRFAPGLLVHSAVPPMHACLALPQPLRWFMGKWAKQMNQSLAAQLIGQVGRTMHWHPETTTTMGMAADGIHPSSEGYAVWAHGLSQRILAARATRTTAQGAWDVGNIGELVPNGEARSFSSRARPEPANRIGTGCLGRTDSPGAGTPH